MRDEDLVLKPCPFCGMPMEGWNDLYMDDGMHYVCCHGCGARTDSSYTVENAVRLWNTRAEERSDTHDNSQ